MSISEKSITLTGSILFYIGGAVWMAYAVARYALDWDVTIRQFLPFHLGAVIPGIILRRGARHIIKLLT